MTNTAQFQGRQLTCADCGQKFIFSAAEQASFRKMGYSEPLRCKACNRARKEIGAKAGNNKGGGK